MRFLSLGEMIRGKKKYEYLHVRNDTCAIYVFEKSFFYRFTSHNYCLSFSAKNKTKEKDKHTPCDLRKPFSVQYASTSFGFIFFFLGISVDRVKSKQIE